MLVVSPQLVYCTRVLECCRIFVRLCLYRTGKHRYLAACCSDCCAFSLIDSSDVLYLSPNHGCTSCFALQTIWVFGMYRRYVYAGY